MLLSHLNGGKFNLTYFSSSGLNCGSRVLYFAIRLERGSELLVIPDTSVVPSFGPSLQVQGMSVCSSSLTHRILVRL